MTISRRYHWICARVFIIGFFIATMAHAYPESFQDSEGNDIRVLEKPIRVISLVPGITEIIVSIGAGDSLIGITYHDTDFIDADKKSIVGGFFSPSVDRINALSPDVVFYSDLHTEVKDRLKDKPVLLINFETHSISDIYAHINLLGRMFDRKSEADRISGQFTLDLYRTQQKVQLIPESKRKRVIRVMGGGDSVRVPGDDSFQNEYIRLAGGIPPHLGKNGDAIPITPEEWKQFNPEIIYDCGKSDNVRSSILEKDEWKDVDAVKNGRLYDFPCALTCRGSIHAAYFIAWLTASIYPDDYSEPKYRAYLDQVLESRPLSVVSEPVASARILESLIYDFIHRTLIVELKSPMRVLSTLEGLRNDIRFVGNSYSSPPTWSLYHRIGLEQSRNQLYTTLKLDPKETSMLFTGADMNNLAISQKSYKEIQVTALVTAGVESNAVRMSKDIGTYYEPGTINVILLTNMKLSERAMTRAIISATEAKTAAMQDLDIRSRYTGIHHAATGTGTDNVMVVEGTGKPIDNAGGHTKMGELIAKAVHEGVLKAVLQQNWLSPGRNLFRRLKERGLSLHELVDYDACECNASRSDWIRVLEDILLTPKYEGFLEMAFALSDDVENGLITDISLFSKLCDSVAVEIANGKPVEKPSPLKGENLPPVIRMALDALMKGAMGRMTQ